MLTKGEIVRCRDVKTHDQAVSFARKVLRRAVEHLNPDGAMPFSMGEELSRAETVLKGWTLKGMNSRRPAFLIRKGEEGGRGG